MQNDDDRFVSIVNGEQQFISGIQRVVGGRRQNVNGEVRRKMMTVAEQ